MLQQAEPFLQLPKVASPQDLFVWAELLTEVERPGLQ